MNYISKGRIYKNCSPSAGQQSALAADSSFRQTLNNSYQTDFGESQDIFDSLNSSLSSIVDKGPNQTGMSPAELASENSEAINNAAAANKNVQAQIGDKAAVTGATPGVESGVTAATRAGASSSIENNLSNEEAGITQQDYALGRQQYQSAVSGEEALPGQTINPTTGAANAETGAETAAGNQAEQNEQSSSSWMGLVGGLAGSAAQGLAKQAASSSNGGSVSGSPTTLDNDTSVANILSQPTP
jgi:hypothetical protein